SRRPCAVSALVPRHPPTHTLFPYTTLFRSRPPCSLITSCRPSGENHANGPSASSSRRQRSRPLAASRRMTGPALVWAFPPVTIRSEEHTSELQSQSNHVCRLLLEKKKDLHFEVEPLMTLTSVVYLSCALLSLHVAVMLMALAKRHYVSLLVVIHRPLKLLCRVSLF